MRGVDVIERIDAAGVFDRMIGACSLVSNDPVLDVRDFDWTQALRDNWQAIRDEALAHSGVEDGIDHCPVTSSVVAAIPGIESASFSTLAAGVHVPAGRGMTKGLLTCHLGLVIPRDADVRMRVRDRMVRWAEGETLLFDDTNEHEAWNDSREGRVVLRVQLRRPLRQPGRWIADLWLRMRRSAARHRISAR